MLGCGAWRRTSARVVNLCLCMLNICIYIYFTLDPEDFIRR